MGHNHDRVVAGLITERDLCRIREAVCIQVEKIFDSCREKDCIEDAPVIFKDHKCIRWLINRAINVKIRKAEVLDVFTDIEEVPFKRGFFTVDIKFFIKVTLDFFVPKRNGGVKIIPKEGLIVFDKKVILFGSEGSVKIFKSSFVEDGIDRPRIQQDNLPVAKVEVAEPIALNARIEELCEKIHDDCCWADHMPRHISEAIGNDENEDLLGDEELGADIDERFIPRRRVVATVGIFSIIKLVRLVQLLIPAFDFCVPNKECIAATDENPCELFETIEFPVDEFFPPQIFDFPGALESEKEMTAGMEEHHHKHD